MDLRDQPARHARLQHSAALIGIERADLAEHVHEPRVGRGGGEHLAAHERDVVIGTAGELVGHDVRAKERGVVGERARQTQCP